MEHVQEKYLATLIPGIDWDSMEMRTAHVLLCLAVLHSLLLPAWGQQPSNSFPEAAKIVTEEDILQAEQPSRGFIARVREYRCHLTAGNRLLVLQR